MHLCHNGEMNICLLMALSLTAAWGMSHPLHAAPTTQPSERFEQVQAEAKNKAGEPFQAAGDDLPEPLGSLGYDEYRTIQFLPDKTVWRDRSLFELQLFHRGYIFKRGVDIVLVSEGRQQPLDYRPDFFSYPDGFQADALPQDLGYAGFRLLFPLNRAGKADELISFLGASYFRALGRHQAYGASARGLAINTGTGEPEEFPVFTKFWIVQPPPEAKSIELFALLESPGVTGAYRFLITPGDETTVDVHALIYPRQPVAKLCLAPMSSMFAWGEQTPRPDGEYRPEVHDSDGLSILTDTGEWLWRPLRNPAQVSVSTFQIPSPQGFGLMQRDRQFTHYHDLEARYHQRPSIWVQPTEPLPPGHLELLEYHSPNEFHDNVAAYWVCGSPAQAGQEITARYRLYFSLEHPEKPKSGTVIATRIAATDQADVRLMVDFGKGEMEKADRNHPPEAVITATAADVRNVTVQWIPETKGWRMTFDLIRRSGTNPDTACKLRAFLKKDQNVLSETWSYAWKP